MGIVIGGVDTHSALHCAAAIDARGRLVDVREFPASSGGYVDLLQWLRSQGRVDQVGVEGTGAYGAGLCRLLQTEGIEVLEVARPDRRQRRNRGKSDPLDAEAAARSVLAGTASVIPKGGCGPVEAIRSLRVARHGAQKARTAAMNALRSLLITAPEPLRERLRGERTAPKLIAACIAFRPDLERLADPMQSTKFALRSLARRVADLTEEIRQLDRRMRELLVIHAPATYNSFALGLDTTAALLVAIGDNPDRLRSEGAFARLCGVAPIPASSGNTRRHRLHRGGNRSANSALHVAVIVRMRYCPRTRAYVARRTSEGLSKPEIIRCLKRHLAREIFRTLLADYEAIASI